MKFSCHVKKHYIFIIFATDANERIETYKALIIFYHIKKNFAKIYAFSIKVKKRKRLIKGYSKRVADAKTQM